MAEVHSALQVNIFKRVEQKKLLSSVEKLGLLRCGRDSSGACDISPARASVPHVQPALPCCHCGDCCCY